MLLLPVEHVSTVNLPSESPLMRVLLISHLDELSLLRRAFFELG